MLGGYTGWDRNELTLKNKGVLRSQLKVYKNVSGMSNWKAPGPGDVKRFWFKKIKNQHDQIA